MLGSLTPERLQQLLVEVAHEEADRYKAALLDALEEGWLFWSLVSGDLRFKGYMANTIMEDLPLVLEPNYIDLYHQQMAPDLIALQLWNQAQQQSMATGQPISDTSKLLWGMLLVLPKWVFERFQRDFISLTKQYMRQQPQQQPVVTGVPRFAGGGTIGVDSEADNYGPSGGLGGPFQNEADVGDPLANYYWRNAGKDALGNYQGEGNSDLAQMARINPFDRFINAGRTASDIASGFGHTAQLQDTGPTGDPRWLNIDKAPPLNEGTDTRLQAAAQGLGGLGLDPRLMSLGGVDQRVSYKTPTELAKMNAGAYYMPTVTPDTSAHALTPNTPPPSAVVPGGGSIVLAQPEHNVGDAVRQEGFMHEALHNLETYMTPQDKQQLAAVMKMNPVPPAFNTWHPEGITGYFDAWDGTQGQYQIPPAIIQFINDIVSRNHQ